MGLRVADRIEDWDERPVERGYAGLTELADDEFSGVVRAGGAELYMTAGTVVGIERGSVGDFEAASGTAYVAPDPGLPLLCVMQAADAEVRAQYYTEETPISEVDGTLSDGSFTGYIELSENVLSGDYFLAYHGGTSTAVGFVGAAERLISGDEAFETASDEVGIYKVRQVDVEPIDIPQPTDDGGEAVGDTEPAEDTGEPADDAAESAEDAAEPAENSGETSAEPGGEAEPTDGTAKNGESEREAAAEPAEASSSAPERSDAEHTVQPSDLDNPPSEATESAGGTRTTGGGGRSGRPATRQASDDRRDRSPSGQPETTTSGRDAVDLETRSVPSLDPQRSTPPGPDTPPTPSEPEGRPDPGGPTAEPERAPAGEDATAEPPSVAVLEDEIAEREAEIDRLESEFEGVREERDDLVAEVERLESEVERLEERLGGAADADRRLSPSEAIQGTNLFVEYESKSDATLARASAGSADREEVAGNLRLGIHTEFEAEGASVDGRPFDEWLRSTLEFRFAEWLVDTLLFEIRDTGHAEDLADLFEAIPEIRRVEFEGVIDVETEDEGTTSQERFDVIFRHRMGDPLVVANLNDARDPATGGMMEQLVTTAEQVGRSADSLASAVLVTSSFFESAALETVSEATRSGILSRDNRTSFVNLSRKQGYHLCLVAAREGNFHLEVPEL